MERIHLGHVRIPDLGLHRLHRRYLAEGSGLVKHPYFNLGAFQFRTWWLS